MVTGVLRQRKKRRGLIKDTLSHTKIETMADVKFKKAKQY